VAQGNNASKTLMTIPHAAAIAAVAILLATASTARASEPAGASVAAPTAAKAKRAVEYTYLKSLPGERENLKRFITANWFAMDAIAVSQGLMVSYQLLDTGNDDGPWNVVVAVTYPNSLGYSSIAPQFEKIRRAHQTVLIDGKGMRDLGKVIETRPLFEDVTSK
jgi:hypothetical protein